MYDYRADRVLGTREESIVRANPKDDLIRKLWNPAYVRRLARDLADVAAEALTVENGPVRRPEADRIASELLKQGSRKPDLVRMARKIRESSLALSHPRYGAQQVAAPIPAAALVESVVAALNQSLAVWEMSPIGTAIDRDLVTGFKKLFGYPRTAEGSLVPGGAFANLTALLRLVTPLNRKLRKMGTLALRSSLVRRHITRSLAPPEFSVWGAIRCSRFHSIGSSRRMSSRWNAHSRLPGKQATGSLFSWDRQDRLQLVASTICRRSRRSPQSITPGFMSTPHTEPVWHSAAASAGD